MSWGIVGGIEKGSEAMTVKDAKADAERFDLRVLELKIRKGELTQEEYDAFLKKLPNDEGNAEYIEVYEEAEGEVKTRPENLTFT